MFGNKHITTALIVAPILAILAYFLVDQMVSEKAQPATAQSAYTLLVKPNCRHASGHCSLENGDVEIELRFDLSHSKPRLLLESNLALVGIKLGLNGQLKPSAMVAQDSQNTHWQLTMPSDIKPEDTLQLALQIQKSYYYAEITLPFMHYKTSFGIEK